MANGFMREHDRQRLYEERHGKRPAMPKNKDS